MKIIMLDYQNNYIEIGGSSMMIMLRKILIKFNNLAIGLNVQYNYLNLV